MRWPGDRQIEEASVGNGGRAVFCDNFSEVSDEQWASADAVVSAPDIPQEFRDRLKSCRIMVTPKVGFDNIDLAAWGELQWRCCSL
jgi:phosphoglycerate dehydrogenase-like enzyme